MASARQSVNSANLSRTSYVTMQDVNNALSADQQTSNETRSFGNTMPHGFEQVCKYTEDGLQMSKDIANFYKKRQQIELEYARQLEKLSISMQGNLPESQRVRFMDENSSSRSSLFTGSLTQTWFNVLEGALFIAHIHENFASSISSEFVEPVQANNRHLDGLRKQLISEGQRLTKELQESYTILKKSKSVMERAQKETEDALFSRDRALNNPSTKEKDLSKLKLKAEQAAERLASSTSVWSANDVRSKGLQEEHYTAKMPAVLDQLHEVEVDRCVHMKEMLSVAGGIDSMLGGKIASILSTAADCLVNVDPVYDINNYLNNIHQLAGNNVENSVMSLRNPDASARFAVKCKGNQPLWKGWKDLFLVLMQSRRMLFLFDSEDSIKPRHIIDIPNGERVIRPVDDSLFSPRANVFQIITRERTFFIDVEVKDELDMWKEKLSEVSMRMLVTNRGDAEREISSLSVGVMEAKDLPSKGDYYAITMLDWEMQARTVTKSNTAAPFWGESYSFDDLPTTFSGLHVTVHSKGGILQGQRNTEIGRCIVTKRALVAAPDGKVEEWLPLISDDKSQKGSIRLRLVLTNERIMPLKAYDELLSIVKSDVKIISEVEALMPPKTRERVAKTYIRVYHGIDRALDFITQLCSNEISSMDNPNIIFRGNSLATKTVDQFMKMVGMGFLRRAANGPIQSVIDNKPVCEVDPTRVGSAAEIEKNQRRLMALMNTFWASILHAIDSVPPELRIVFHSLQTYASTKFSDDPNIKYTAVSGFFFLRFFCPAILNPKLFDMMNTHPEDTVARTLTLIAKTHQNLANLVEFGAKEPFMSEMNVFILENLEKVKAVLNQISTPPPSTDVVLPLPPVDLARELATLHSHYEDNIEIIQTYFENTNELLVGRLLESLKVLRECPKGSSNIATVSIDVHHISESNPYKKVVYAVVLYDYEAIQDDEISIVKDSIIEILDDAPASAPGWFLASVGDKYGLIPLSYVEINDEIVISENDDDEFEESDPVPLNPLDPLEDSDPQSRGILSRPLSMSLKSFTSSKLRKLSKSPKGSKRNSANLLK